MIIRAAGIFFILLVSFKQIFIIVYFPSILLLKEEVIEKFKQVKEYVYQEVEEKDDEEKALEIKVVLNNRICKYYINSKINFAVPSLRCTPT